LRKSQWESTNTDSNSKGWEVYPNRATFLHWLGPTTATEQARETQYDENSQKWRQQADLREKTCNQSRTIGGGYGMHLYRPTHKNEEKLI